MIRIIRAMTLTQKISNKMPKSLYKKFHYKICLNFQKAAVMSAVSQPWQLTVSQVPLCLLAVLVIICWKFGTWKTWTKQCVHLKSSNPLMVTPSINYLFLAIMSYSCVVPQGIRLGFIILMDIKTLQLLGVICTSKTWRIRKAMWHQLLLECFIQNKKIFLSLVVLIPA